MAYQILAEKRDSIDLDAVGEQLLEYQLIEFFPIEFRSEYSALGVSIPLKALDDAGFGAEFNQLMNYLISALEFEVYDLYTGNRVRLEEIDQLAQQIMG